MLRHAAWEAGDLDGLRANAENLDILTPYVSAVPES